MHACTHIPCFWAQVQALLQIASLATFGDIHVAYIGPGGDSVETILVLTMQVDYFFVQSSFDMVLTISTQMNYTLAGLLASPLWVGGPALRHFRKCCNSANVVYNILHAVSNMGAGYWL